MTGTTTTEGYPYPLTSDFADVQDAFRLASSIDADLRSEQAPFRAFMSRPSFITRQNSNGSGFLVGTQNVQLSVTEWDNTGGVGGSAWTQPAGQAPSWWLFGCTILVVLISGTPVVGDMNLGRIEVDTTDQVTGVVTSSFFYQRNDESNTGGEMINLFAIAPLYRGSAEAALILNGSSQKAVQSGSRFWGMYLGPVT